MDVSLFGFPSNILKAVRPIRRLQLEADTAIARALRLRARGFLRSRPSHHFAMFVQCFRSRSHKVLFGARVEDREFRIDYSPWVAAVPTWLHGAG